TLLRDTIATGVRRENYTKSRGDKKAWDLKPMDSWVFTEVPAIISEETWQKCNELLDEIAGKNPKPAKVPVHLFGGLTFCSCGEKMYVVSNTKKYICQGCRNKILAEDLEQIFFEEIKSYLNSEMELNRLKTEVSTVITEKETILTNLKSEINSLSEKLEQLLEL